jgi:hypothetical protein
MCAENDVEFLGAAVFFPTPVFLERVVRLIAIYSINQCCKVDITWTCRNVCF